MSKHESFSPIRYMAWIFWHVLILILWNIKSLESEFFLVDHISHLLLLIFKSNFLFLFLSWSLLLFFLLFLIIFSLRLFCNCLSLIIQRSSFATFWLSIKSWFLIISTLKENNIWLFLIPPDRYWFDVHSLSVFIKENESVVIDK